MVKNLKLKTTKAIIIFIAIACLAFKGFSQQFNNNVKSKSDNVVIDTSSKKNLTSIIDTINFDPNIDLAEQIMPIDSILNYVCKYSPTLKMIEAEEDKSKYNRKYISALWLNGIGLFYNYTYGNQFTSLVSSTMTDQQLSNNLGLGYRLGVNVQFLLGEIYGRKSRLKSLQAEVEMAKQKRAEAIIEVKRKVISDYYDLIANQRLVKLKQTDAESAALTANIAEYEMKRGKIMPSDLSRLKNIQSIADVNLQLSIRDYMVSYNQLEALLGCSLSSFKNKKAGNKN
jgi:outer membrane protein TolC